MALRRKCDHHRSRQPLSAVSRVVIVDRDVKFMRNLHSAAASGVPYGARIGKRRNRYVRQSLSDLSLPNEEPAATRRQPNHVRTVSPFIPVYSTLVFTHRSPDLKVIMQYQDDFVGSSRSYFSLFYRRRTLAPVVTIIYEGCVPGIQRAHLTCEVTCTGVAWPAAAARRRQE